MAKRTTVSLEEDVAIRLEERVRRTGASFKEIINQAIRAGLALEESVDEEPFRVQPRSLGLRRGLSYDNIGELLERAEGPEHR